MWGRHQWGSSEEGVGGMGRAVSGGEAARQGVFVLRRLSNGGDGSVEKGETTSGYERSCGWASTP